ncbi:MAG: GntR family transcriptional regulator [Burkholderiaceae bacterium]
MDLPNASGPRMGNATQHAVQRILMMIMCGDIGPGEQIRQQEMAEQCGISRVPLREALNVLAQQGLLLHRPNQGYFVAKRGPGELAQIRRMLHLLENDVMSSLHWPSADQLARLRSLNEEMRSLLMSPEWGKFAACNRQFHVQILACSPMRLMVEEIRRLYTLADPFFGAKFERLSARQKTIDEHELIISALDRRDREALINAVEIHRYSNATGFTQSMADGRAITVGADTPLDR